MFAFLANYLRQKSNKIGFIFFSVLAILCGSFLAGVRAATVGTDVITYGNYIFRLASSSDSPIKLFVIQGSIIEPLYLLLNFVVSRFTHDVHWMYFVLQIIPLSLAYISIARNRENDNLSLSLMVYYLTFYAFSLNGLRQAIAMSLLLFAYQYIYEENFKKYLIVILVAAGFHYSAILFLFLYFIYHYIRKSDHKKISDAVIVLAFVAAIVFSQTIIRLFVVFVPKYERYITSARMSFSLNPFLVRIPLILIMLIFYKRYQRKDQRFDFWLVMLIGDAVFIELRTILPALSRLSFYFATAKVDAYPFLDKVYNKKSRWIVDLFLVAFLFLLWYYQIVLQGGEDVYPYASDVISWLN